MLSGNKSFFKPKNKLKHKFGFRKSAFIPSLLKKEGEKVKSFSNSTISRKKINKEKNANSPSSSIKTKSKYE